MATARSRGGAGGFNAGAGARRRWEGARPPCVQPVSRRFLRKRGPCPRSRSAVRAGTRRKPGPPCPSGPGRALSVRLWRTAPGRHRWSSRGARRWSSGAPLPTPIRFEQVGGGNGQLYRTQKIPDFRPPGRLQRRSVLARFEGVDVELSLADPALPAQGVPRRELSHVGPLSDLAENGLGLGFAGNKDFADGNRLQGSELNRILLVVAPRLGLVDEHVSRRFPPHRLQQQRLLAALVPRHHLLRAQRLSEVDDVGTVARRGHETGSEGLELRDLPGKAVAGEHLEQQTPGGNAGKLQLDHVGARSLVDDVEIEAVLLSGPGGVRRGVSPFPFPGGVAVVGGEEKPGDGIDAPGATFPRLEPAETAGDQAAVVFAVKKANARQMYGAAEIEQVVPVARIRVIRPLVAIDHVDRESDIPRRRHAPPRNPVGSPPHRARKVGQDGKAVPFRKGGEVGIGIGSLGADRFRPQLEARGRSEARLVDPGPGKLHEFVLHLEVGGRLAGPSETEESEGRGGGRLEEENQTAGEQVEMASSVCGQITGPALNPERGLRLFASMDEKLMNSEPDRRPRKACPRILKEK